MSGDMKIVKVDGVGDPIAPPPPKKGSSHRDKKPKHGILKHGKTARKTPRFEAVRDPAKPPPMKHKSTLRILTEKGLSKRRKTIKKSVDGVPIQNLRATLRKSGLPVSDKTPEHIVREIAAGGMEAGMIPL